MADNSIAARDIQTNAVTASKLDPNMALSVASGAFTGNVTVGGTLTVTGATTHNGATTIATTATQPLAITRIDPTVYATTVGIPGLSSKMTASPAAGSTESYFGVTGESIATTGQTSAGMTGVFGRTTLNSAGGAPTVTTGIGVDSELKFTAAGTISNAYGYHTKVTYGPGPTGTLTKYVGFYMENPLANGGGGVNSALPAAQYGIVSDGSASKNFFAGNVGIGNNNPADALDVTGNVATTGVVTLTGVAATSANGSNPVCIDNVTGTVTRSVNGGGCATVSDRRLKKDITPISGALDKLLSLTGVTYFWKDKASGTERHVGLIAQDVQKVYPEIVTKVGPDHLGIDYQGMIGPLVQAVKELHAKWLGDHQILEQADLKLSQLEKKIELENLALKAENKQLKDRLDKIELALAATPAKAPAKKGRKLATK
ncbi:MAG: tail fiber domain-containing protein, partial [Bdellovibrionota bacterium]